MFFFKQISMTKFKIYGTGLIGNHYAFACYKTGWEITAIDKNPKSLDRMKHKIFTSSYGFCDKAMNLSSTDINNFF